MKKIDNLPSQEEVDDLSLLDGERVEVHVLQTLDLAICAIEKRKDIQIKR